MINHKMLALVACVSFASLSPITQAQSTSGSISGEAITGDTVYVTNNDIGFKREVKISKDGKYQVRNIPVGTYQLIRKHADGSFEPSQQLDVRTGATSRAKPPEAAAAANSP